MIRPTIVCFAFSAVQSVWAGDAVTPAAVGRPSPCQAGEFVYFACTTTKDKLASVCGSPPDFQGKRQLVYRYGSANKPDLEYPEPAQRDPGAFRLSLYGRSQTSVATLAFKRGGYRYEIFDRTEDGKEEAGISVQRSADHKELSRVRCKSPWQSELAELESIVPCDSESALTMGECK